MNKWPKDVPEPGGIPYRYSIANLKTAIFTLENDIDSYAPFNEIERKQLKIMLKRLQKIMIKME